MARAQMLTLTQLKNTATCTTRGDACCVSKPTSSQPHILLFPPSSHKRQKAASPPPHPHTKAYQHEGRGLTQGAMFSIQRHLPHPAFAPLPVHSLAHLNKRKRQTRWSGRRAQAGASNFRRSSSTHPHHSHKRLQSHPTSPTSNHHHHPSSEGLAFQTSLQLSSAKTLLPLPPNTRFLHIFYTWLTQQ